MIRQISEALKQTTIRLTKSGVSSPSLDAQLLTSHAVGMDRSAMLARLDEKINEQHLRDLESLVERRENREPLAYIVGSKEFYSINFTVDHRTLIPRPETELLVDAALDQFNENDHITVLDIGAGCGAIAMTLAQHRPKWKITASDISVGAIEVMKQNAQNLGLADRLDIVTSDLFENFHGRRFDMIVSNPPYIVKGDQCLEPEIWMYEPEVALYASDNGLAILSYIIDNARDHLKPGGALILEVGYGQACYVVDILERDGDWNDVRSLEDMQGIERVIAAIRK